MHLVTFGGHFHTIRNQWTLSNLMPCPFSHEKNWHKLEKSVLNMASSDSQIDKPQHEHPKTAELPDVNINTAVQSIKSESFLNSSSVG